MLKDILFISGIVREEYCWRILSVRQAFRWKHLWSGLGCKKTFLPLQTVLKLSLIIDYVVILMNNKEKQNALFEKETGIPSL